MWHELVVKVMSGKVAETVTKPSEKKLNLAIIFQEFSSKKKKILDTSQSLFVCFSFSLNSLSHCPIDDQTNRMFLNINE